MFTGAEVSQNQYYCEGQEEMEKSFIDPTQHYCSSSSSSRLRWWVETELIVVSRIATAITCTVGTGGMVGEVKVMLRLMEDGEISVSAYDTAWVALAKDPDMSDRPLFPESLRWIVSNQLGDGSWGNAVVFNAHDRLINTLACAIVLAFWNLHSDKCLKGRVLFFSK
ncbi:hypothetical protein ZIOFF_017491 [Zingiber officinale]|uniref:Uncharacterized protein n=1 Tax=Zingiber officinale TaxID=94328 RepID=A0A8J5HBS4_ZINOF|nr:hypothetical protein ZIOFF_017491 [Zingiber officinale]